MKLNRFLSPFRMLILSYFVLIIIASLFLYMPISHQDGVSLSYVEALFTATSAITVTGLTVVNTADTFSLFGVIVLMIIIQLGGVGIMTMGTFVWMILGQKINFSKRMMIMVDHNQVNFSGLVRLMRNILAIVILIELLGAIFFGTYYLNYFDTWYEAYYQGTFASLTAMTNAGFDITGESLIPFAGDYVVQFATMLLIIAGAIGFPVLVEIREYLSGKHPNYRFSLFTKITVTTYMILLVFGALVIWLLESGNYYVGMSIIDQFFHSLFNSVTARSAGLTIMDISEYSMATLLFISGLMIIGASPSSVGGGIRTTTFAVMVLSIRAFALGQREVKVFGRELHTEDVQKSFIVMSVFMFGLFGSIMLVSALERSNDVALLAIIFEVSSAFGTCGLSIGITPELTVPSQFVLMVLMFIGRVGLVALLFSMKKKDATSHFHYPRERIIIG